MNPQTTAQPNPAHLPLVMWIIWAALISGVVVLQVFLGGGWPQGKNAPGAAFNPFVIVCAGLIAASTAVRWLVLPRFAALNQKFVMMIVGLALSEGAVIFQIFLLPRNQPETRAVIFACGLLGMVQFTPLFARTKPGAALR